LDISFNTAWSAPVPIFRKIIETFPKLSFHCEWRDEDEPEMVHTLSQEDGDSIWAIIAKAGAAGSYISHGPQWPKSSTRFAQQLS
jgi:Ferredoxin-like domain in Api92-like protein